MSKTNEVYAQVTDAIIAELENGNVPWSKPWAGGAVPQNLNSRRPYSGINAFVLGLRGAAYGSPFWVTFKGCTALGGKVRKGEKSTVVMFWKELTVKDEEAENGKRKVLMAKTYRVFNVMQCDGLEVPDIDAERGVDFDPVAEAERIVADMPNRPSIGYGGDAAYYMPSTDHVQLPERSAFLSMERFYGTMFHELAHSTGHASRLNRDGVTGVTSFGSATYSKEELVAELSACFLSAESGITPDVPQSAAYCRSWLKALKDDRKMLVNAASKASKATDYIIGR